MNISDVKLSIFTKPWKSITIPKLGELVSGLGFDGIEFPLRDGFQVQPCEAVQKLPLLACELLKYNLKIFSVAGSTDETTFAACQAAGVSLIRIMLEAELEKGYLNCELQWLHRLEAMERLCQKYNVNVGIQPHYGAGIFGTMELRHLLEKCSSKYIGAIWDSAHSGLSGEEPEQALDIIWEYLLLVNLKSAYYAKGYDALSNTSTFIPYFTMGRDGTSSWSRIIKYLKKHEYEGCICMPAEYTDEEGVERYIAQDFNYIKELLSSR